jgi:hypothetical protein
MSLASTYRNEYLAFCNARRRCTVRQDKNWKSYGGRGIRFCFATFYEFFDELGPRPEGLVLDRKNNDGHYERGNVRWVTKKESIQNSRHCRARGSRIADQAKREGVSYHVIWQREHRKRGRARKVRHNTSLWACLVATGERKAKPKNC